MQYGWISHCTNRSVISVYGDGATDFLQNLVSNDMRKFSTQPDRAALFAVMMNAKGRILFDLNIVKPHLAN